VVIAVLACAMSVRGQQPSAVLTVLGGAAVVAAGTLFIVRQGGRGLGHTMLRVVHAVAAS
jgi:hypothetical protein